MNTTPESTPPVTVQQSLEDVIFRTSSNNMLCVVEYLPLSIKEQADVEEIFRVAA